MRCNVPALWLHNSSSIEGVVPVGIPVNLTVPLLDVPCLAQSALGGEIKNPTSDTNPSQAQEMTLVACGPIGIKLTPRERAPELVTAPEADVLGGHATTTEAGRVSP